MRIEITFWIDHEFQNYHFVIVDGVWGDWAKETCVTNIMKRFRSCDNPSPRYGGNVS